MNVNCHPVVLFQSNDSSKGHIIHLGYVLILTTYPLLDSSCLFCDVHCCMAQPVVDQLEVELNQTLIGLTQRDS